MNPYDRRLLRKTGTGRGRAAKEPYLDGSSIIVMIEVTLGYYENDLLISNPSDSLSAVQKGRILFHAPNLALGVAPRSEDLHKFVSKSSPACIRQDFKQGYALYIITGRNGAGP